MFEFIFLSRTLFWRYFNQLYISGMKQIKKLQCHFPQSGRVEWIGIRPDKGQPIQEVSKIEALTGRGLQGDKAGRRAGGKRQVTLIQCEYIPLLQTLLPDANISLASLRRNIGITGINLNALKDRSIRIGEAVLEVTGFCHPCSKLEQQLGYGVFNALRGHGGLTAKVTAGGHIAVGDLVQVIYPV